MKLNLKTKTVISVVAFLLIFVALILVASFCDYQISQIMTKGSLAKGDYFSTNFFGVLLESVGCIPIYLMIAFILCVLFWSCIKLWDKKPLNIVCAVVLAIGVVAACWYAIKDSASYVFEHTLASTGDIAGNLKAVKAFKGSAAMFCIEAVFGLIMGALAILATKHFNEDTLKKLLRFSLAVAVAVALANILIMIIKDPVGRMRFRAINSSLGQMYIDSKTVKGYTAWYVSNGQPSLTVINSFKETYGVSDAFKSFPSGHTCSAGTIYALIMIPTLFEYTGKKEKRAATIACWVVPIIYTALVAISRIMVGAHYMSDVTFGGTLSFVCIVIAWEIFICKGSHFFALFPKLQKAKAVDGAEDSEVIGDSVQAVDAEIMTDIAETDESAVVAENSVEESISEAELVIPSQTEENAAVESVAEEVTESVDAE